MDFNLWVNVGTILFLIGVSWATIKFQGKRIDDLEDDVEKVIEVARIAEIKASAVEIVLTSGAASSKQKIDDIWASLNIKHRTEKE